MQRDYFLGGASPEGFETAFWDANTKRGCYGFYLKGGPGTGKSTLMKKIAAAFAGEHVSVYHCASDPSSLDAVVLEDRCIFVADATAPHSNDPALPYVTGETVDLAAGLNSAVLRPERETILRLSRENKAAHAQARKGIAGIAAICVPTEKAGQSALLRDKLTAYAGRFCKRMLPDKKTGAGAVLHRQCSALTPAGKLTFLSENCDLILLRDDLSAAAPLFLETVCAEAAASGYCCEVTHALTRHGRPLTHLILPEIGLAIADKAAVDTDTQANAAVIGLNRFYEPEIRKQQRSAAKFSAKAAADTEEKTVSLLAEALRIHDELESFYIKALQPAFLDEAAETLISKIRGYA